tara:strand:- start:21105 stop:21959 length:855 start_codon:yes stop_codon:yes gene_type:complete
MNIRRLRMGLKTVLGIAKEGFFIPYRYAASLPGPEDRKPYAAIETVMAAHEDRFTEMLDSLAAFEADFADFGTAPPPEPRFEQDWFPRLDAAICYAMVRMQKPARIIEVGSGHSTRFMARAIRDGKLATEFIAIDPAPRASIETLPITFVRRTLHEAGTEIFNSLEPGDILFIDSSHIAIPGTDVDDLFLNVIPALPDGVIIHIHDIFLPDDYPKDWEWRGYNEQQMVAPMFLYGGFDILFSSAYVRSRMRKRLDHSFCGRLPIPNGAYETSLWLMKGAARQKP